MIRPWLLGLILSFLALFSFAQPLIEAPQLTRPVIDEAGFLSLSGQATVESALRSLLSHAKVQMAIYIPQNLKGLDIESFSISVAEQWKLGKKGLGADGSRGLLLVIAPEEKRMRLEVGYGLEGAIPDARARRILDHVLKPYLRSNQPIEGLVGVIAAVSESVGAAWRPEGSPQLHRASRRRGGILRGPFEGVWLVISFLICFVIFLVRRLSAPRSYRWSSGGGGWSGGGWSGGGGGFGGGGASSSW